MVLECHHLGLMACPDEFTAGGGFVVGGSSVLQWMMPFGETMLPSTSQNVVFHSFRQYMWPSGRAKKLLVVSATAPPSPHLPCREPVGPSEARRLPPGCSGSRPRRYSALPHRPPPGWAVLNARAAGPMVFIIQTMDTLTQQFPCKDFWCSFTCTPAKLHIYKVINYDSQWLEKTEMSIHRGYAGKGSCCTRGTVSKVLRGASLQSAEGQQGGSLLCGEDRPRRAHGSERGGIRTGGEGFGFPRHDLELCTISKY